MQALWFIERLPSSPSSAWAVRPSAASARAVAARCGRWPAWSQVRTRLCLQSGWTSSVFVETARSATRSGRRAARQEVEEVVGLCLVEVAVLSQPSRNAASPSGLTEEAANTKQPVRQSRRAVTLGSVQRLARRSAVGWPAPVGASSAPNPSVKGTSCGKPQAAPYVER